MANAFNGFFISKIDKLKENIDPNQVRDPLEKIKEKMKNKNLKLKLKLVSAKTVKKLMNSMAAKKSKGNDGVPQDCLLLGQEVIVNPLTNIINTSIEAGVFPELWKEAIVVPILKKGDAKELSNYRPVSCLPAASKVLEKVVCEQLTRFAEINQILPNNQHGFRAQRSTMTALSSMQKEWIANTESGLLTGILVWDLSSAFDTLDIKLFLSKMSIYGADRTTLDGFSSFLSGRTQRVRIGSALSAPGLLTSGVPQGGILSPIVFTIYTADMELWLKSSKVFNFADDTTTDTKGKEPMDIKLKLEKDAINALQFMASNGLVANQKKTEFMVLNEKVKTGLLDDIAVGDVIIKRTTSTKLLGIYIEESQEWNEHVKALKSTLNQRLFVIRRLMNQIPGPKLMGIVHALWISKVRYGLQLCTKVQLRETDPSSACLRTLQLTQNRLLRLLNGSKKSDKISIKSMLNKFGLLSINQLAAKIKLIETWKSINKEGYPIALEKFNSHVTVHQHNLRHQPNRIFKDTCKFKKSESSFHVDAARLWNAAPAVIKSALTLHSAKKEIDKFCKTLPV